MSSSLLAALQAATAAQHDRTESLVPAGDPALDLAGYAGILARFRAAYAPMESALATVAWPAEFDWAPRRKLPLLDADLAWLARQGIDLPTIAAGPALPAPLSLARAVGTLYVLEGATLGGQVLVRQLAPRLGVDAAGGASFYAGYGARTGAMWKAFGAMAEAWGATAPEAWHEAIEAARDAFDRIGRPFAGG